MILSDEARINFSAMSVPQSTAFGSNRSLVGSQKYLHISVADEGIGIQENEIH